MFSSFDAGMDAGPRRSCHVPKPQEVAAAGCSGSCSTCPDREKCVGFKKPVEHCPGPEGPEAGSASACAGCPNRLICQNSAKNKQADPDLDIIKDRMSKIQKKVLVLSGKGGVGKSTFSTQLSFALAAHEEGKFQVGLLDVDICGPSIPRMLGIEGETLHPTSSGWTPVYVEDNLAAISVQFLLEDPDEAVVWRGPKKNGLIKQFLKDVEWGELDFLVIDTPPGTSDEHLSIVKYLQTGVASDCGAVIVTSPQDVALLDVRKEIRFCQRVGLRVLGVVENMSGFICPCCRKQSTIFPSTSGGAEKMAADMGVPFLGRIPLDPLIARSCDEGKPYFVAHPEADASKQFFSVFKGVIDAIAAPPQTSQQTDSY